MLDVLYPLCALDFAKLRRAASELPINIKSTWQTDCFVVINSMTLLISANSVAQQLVKH